MKNKTQLSLIPKPSTTIKNVFDILTEPIFRDFDVLASPFASFGQEITKGFPFRDTLWEETETDFRQEFEMPRFTKDDIELSIKDNFLHISAEKDNKYRFYHTTSLPTDRANLEKPDAKLDHGVLTVSFPKLESAKAKTIQIN